MSDVVVVVTLYMSIMVMSVVVVSTAGLRMVMMTVVVVRVMVVMKRYASDEWWLCEHDSHYF